MHRAFLSLFSLHPTAPPSTVCGKAPFWFVWLLSRSPSVDVPSQCVLWIPKSLGS